MHHLISCCQAKQEYGIDNLEYIRLKTRVEVRKYGVLVHFWCRFLDIEKAYKILIINLVGLIQRREGFLFYKRQAGYGPWVLIHSLKCKKSDPISWITLSRRERDLKSRISLS